MLARITQFVTKMLWTITFMVIAGTLGAVYGKGVVDKIRLRYVSESAHRPTLATEIRKGDKLYTDRFVSAHPVFRISGK
ncbi:MAG TPA: hypothetical protein VN665_02255 [Candidatus Paceibacterota bacterium]|nr:hypothetical protein [Candidatus Paceibacterota bacterium]